MYSGTEQENKIKCLNKLKGQNRGILSSKYTSNSVVVCFPLFFSLPFFLYASSFLSHCTSRNECKCCSLSETYLIILFTCFIGKKDHQHQSIFALFPAIPSLPKGKPQILETISSGYRAVLCLDTELGDHRKIWKAI